MNLERLMTRGIQADISLFLQALLWGMQTELRNQNDKIDYLQVYELSSIEKNGVTVQLIKHFAEDPNHEALHYVDMPTPIKAKIYIIEDRYTDKLVETMLLAEEY